MLHRIVSNSVSFRIFKAAWFSKAARKAKISDKELCKAIMQVMAGQADSLGGGVYKKRLGNNQYRSIILARGGDYWVYQFLFAKQDMANIDDAELAAFKQLAKIYATMTAAEVERQIQDGHWTQICTSETEQKP